MIRLLYFCAQHIEGNRHTSNISFAHLLRKYLLSSNSVADSVPIGQVYGNEPNSPKCLLCETAILVGRLFLLSVSPSLFSPGQPGHPQEECQAQAAVACSLFSWTNKSLSFLGYLKCAAKPKASSHYGPCGMSPQSSALYVTILAMRYTIFKTRRYFIHQKWGLTPVGN